MRGLLDQIAGKYEVLGQLDESGPAEVYKVRHVFLREVRLIKVVPPLFSFLRAAGEAGEGHLEQARQAMRLRHPNIAQLYDFTLDENGSAFLVTEDLEGLTIEEALRELGPPPLGLALEIGQQALRGLGYLHRGGIVHGAVGPDELVLSRDLDSQPLAKWVDLGTAKVLAAADATIPMAGMFPGRPRYAAPEQFSAAGGQEPEARSDLYSFGVLFYELLTGRCPIAGQDPFSYMASHLSAPPLPFDESDPEGRVPPDLREIVLQMLAKRPEERARNADELARRLAAVEARFPERDGYLDRVLERAREHAAAIRPVVLPAPPAPGPAAPPPVPEPLSVPAGEGTLTLKTADLRIPEPPAAPVPQPEPVPPPPPAAPPPLPREEPEPALDIPYRVAPAREIEWDVPRPEPAAPQVPLEPEPRREEPAVPPAQAAAPRDGSAKRWLVLAAALLVAVLGGVIGWSLSRKTPSPGGGDAEVRAAGSGAQPASGPAASSAAGTVEVEETPASPPPAEGERAETPPPAPARDGREDRKGAGEARPEEKKAKEPEKERRPERRYEIPVESPELRGEPARTGGAGFQRGDMITPGPGVEYPEPAAELSAVYPDQARASGRKGKVRVAVLVDENGNVIQARVAEGDRSGLGFNEASLAAARRMRFLPATKDGVPGKFWMELIYEFDPPPAPRPAPPPAPPPAEPAPSESPPPPEESPPPPEESPPPPVEPDGDLG